MKDYPFQFYLSKARDLEKSRLRSLIRDSEQHRFIDRIQQAPRLILGRTDTRHHRATVSIQASDVHYCQPLAVLEFHHYTSFEVGMPTLTYETSRLLMPYGDGDNSREASEIYGYVPCEVVQEYIELMGGVRAYKGQFSEQGAIPLELSEEDISYYSLL